MISQAEPTNPKKEKLAFCIIIRKKIKGNIRMRINQGGRRVMLLLTIEDQHLKKQTL